MREIQITLTIPENDFKEFGDVSMVIKGICGGTYTYKDAIKEIKDSFKRLN